MDICGGWKRFELSFPRLQPIKGIITTFIRRHFSSKLEWKNKFCEYAKRVLND